MTQFQPPPPVANPVPGYESPSFPPQPVPWSVAAIAGFVLSLLGCMGITSLLGIILGIVGISNTRDGRRKGRGLAIAAIPISLIMGLIPLVGMIVGFSYGQVLFRLSELPMVLQSKGELADQKIEQIRQVFTDDFNQKVSNDKLRAWIKQVHKKYGNFVELKDVNQYDVLDSPDQIHFNLKLKFVNETAYVSVIVDQTSLWDVKVDDIIIGKSSPRD